MRKLLEYLYGKIIFPIQNKNQFGDNFIIINKELLQTENAEKNELEELRNTKLKKLLKFAKANNSFYSSYPIIETNDIEKLIQSLPVLHKEDVKRIPVSNIDSQRIHEHITSGSSGFPLKVLTNETGESYRRAGFYRFLKWHGLSDYNKNVLIWGKLNTQEEKKNNIKKIKNFIFEKTYFINVFKMNSDIKNIYKKLIKFKPRFIRGYKSGILQMCRLLDEQNFNTKKIGLKTAITTSEILFQEERDYIEQTLNVQVIDEYGAAETGLIAVECPLKKKHILTDHVYLFTNKLNEVIITDLDNYLMPIINYYLGDKVIFDSENNCPCGLNFPLIKHIEGRQGDQILRPNGEKVSQYVIYYAVKELYLKGMEDSVKQYKVIQLDMNSFHFYYVKGNKFTKRSIEYLEKRMKEEIDDSIQILFEEVGELPMEKSGKIRFFNRIGS